ncbi:MbcA/ParS/Xre antitoxin family protein [Paucibacter sp. hw1]|uniref:MbcA/ParS/Xre antitoxin family protein n=2 Tax=Roseateles koreensis TaxID=2987526 RepID=A0ABT5KNV4_9BURK|nr:MbcA/ParS/Xre antitoxin family protein [Roseateles koreensis]MDC8784542.1 MbcA/ParS/Xre antitoxin family protein [Roseateles koreensis]
MLLRVYFRIAAAWGLTTEQEMRLLGASKSLFYKWKSGQVSSGLSPSTLERLSYVSRIYAALQILLPIPERANAWVKAANTAPIFGGASALKRMEGGQVGDLMVVADYLDANRGGDFS